MAAPHRHATPTLLACLGLLACLLLAAPCPAADPALIGRWTFDSSTGADSSGHGLDLSAAGPVSYTSGRGGMVASFNGISSGLVHAPDPQFVPGNSSWSLTAWVAPTAPGTGNTQYIVQWYECGAVASCGSPNNALYTLYLDKDGLPGFQFRDDLNQRIQISGTSSLIDGTFHMMAGVYDSTTHRGAFYVDGVKVASDSIPAFTSVFGVASTPLTIGYENIVGWGIPDRWFKGSIDDVRVYRRALTPGDVTSLFTGVTTDVPALTPAPALRAAVAPNPSRSAADLSFTLPAAADVDVQVLDLLGRRVRTLASGVRAAGPARVHWDGADDRGRPAPAGLYRMVIRTRGADGTRAAAAHATAVLLR